MRNHLLSTASRLTPTRFDAKSGTGFAPCPAFARNLPERVADDGAIDAKRTSADRFAHERDKSGRANFMTVGVDSGDTGRSRISRDDGNAPENRQVAARVATADGGAIFVARSRRKRTTGDTRNGPPTGFADGFPNRVEKPAIAESFETRRRESGVLRVCARFARHLLLLPLMLPSAVAADEPFSVTCESPSLQVTTQEAKENTRVSDTGQAIPYTFVRIAFTATGDYFANECGVAFVNVKTSDATAKAGEDYVAYDDGFFFYAEGTQNIDIRIEDDELFEGYESFDVNIEATAFQLPGGKISRRVLIVDNDAPPVLQLTATKAMVAESAGEGVVAVTATLNGSTTGQNVTVDLATTDGTARAAYSDYTVASTSLTISAGETVESGSLVVPVLDDAVDEKDETVEIFGVLLNPQGAVAGSATFADALTIVDDDDLPTVILAPSSVDEDDGSVTFSATLAEASGQVVTIQYETSDVTAEAGEDYESASGTLIFDEGDVVDTFAIEILNDALDENDETFSISLASADGTAQASTHEVMIAFDDDDPPMVSLDMTSVDEKDGSVRFTTTLSEPSGRAVTVEYAAVGGTAEAGEDYAPASGTLTFAKGETQDSFVIDIIDDALDEEIESFSIWLFSADGTAQPSMHAVTITGDDDEPPAVSLDVADVDEEDGKVTFAAVLAAQSGRAVTIEYATADGTAEAGEDYASASGTLYFAKGDTREWFSINITNDDLDEDAENFSILLTSADGTAQESTHSVSIADDDDPPVVTLIPAGVGEGDGMVTFTATLDAASGRAVEIEYATSDGSASAWEDYASASGTLNFAKGDTQDSFAVEITDDALDENEETFDIELTSANGTAQQSTHAVSIVDDDAPPMVTLDVPNVDENDGTVTFTATLGAASGRAVTVGYSTADGTASAGEDYASASGTLNFAIGDTENTFSISIVNDDLDEDVENFSIRLTSADGTAQESTHSVSIADDDDPPAVTLTPVGVGEGDGMVVFTATLDATSGRAVEIEYATSDGTAASGEDYASASGTLNFAKGETQDTFAVEMTDDSADEDEETFSIRLSSADGTAKESAHSVAIADDDDPPMATLTPEVVDEDDGMVTFTATLDAASGRAVEIEYATSDGTAASGEDYASASGTLNFAKGDMQDTFAIDIKDDALDEGDETFAILLTSANGTAAASAHEVTIAGDNDAPPTAEFELGASSVDEGDAIELAATLSVASGRDVTLEYGTADGSASAGSDYVAETSGALTIPAGRTRGTIAIETLEDALDEENETFEVELTSARHATLGSRIEHTVTIVDDPKDVQPTVAFATGGSVAAEDGGEASVAAVLSARSGREVTVEYRTAGGSAAAGSDYVAQTSGMLIFEAGATESEIVVELLDDEVEEHPETFSVELTAPRNAVLGDPDSHTVTIADDDSAEFSVAFDAASVVESGSATATVTMLAPSVRTLRVDYATVAGTAAEGDDYVAKSGRLEFRPGDALERRIAIEIVDDALDEDNESFAFELSNPDGEDAALGTTLRQEVTILDDDPLPAIALTLTRAAVVEGGRIEARATLSPASGREVSVEYETGDVTAEALGDYADEKGTLTFAPGETVKTFYVQTNDDLLAEGDETFDVILSSERNATLNAPNSLAATIEDDDPAEIALTVDPSRVPESGGAIAAAVRLSVASEREVLVDYASVDGGGANGAAAGEDYVAANGTLTFAPGEMAQEFAIAISDDALDEPDENFTVALSNPRGGGGVLEARPARQVTILDDDALPTLTLAADKTVEYEGGRIAATATLTPASGRATTVDYRTVDGTARAGEDYAMAAGTLIFAEGETEKSFEVAIADDQLNELAETFSIELLDPVNAELGNPVSHTVTIAADPADPMPSVAFAKSEGNVREGDTMAVAALLSAKSGREVTVEYGIADVVGENAAVAGEDYKMAHGTLIYAPGVTERSFPVEIVAEGLDEETEVFAVALSDPVGATLGDPSVMRLAILDGDDPILEPIANYLIGRTKALLDAQPRLTRFLDGSGVGEMGGGSLRAGSGGGRADGGFARGGVWGEAAAAWSNEGGAYRRHFAGTLGAHRAPSEDLLLGVLFQYDSIASELADGAGEIGGRGWMAGPYFAANGTGRLRYEGRLLYGGSANDILVFSGSGSEIATRQGSFRGERWLAQARVEGQHPLGSGAVMIPAIDLGHAREAVAGFTDSRGRDVEGQTVFVTRLQLGTEFEIPVEAARGNLTLSPGLRFELTNENGDRHGESSYDSSGQIDFGVNYWLEEHAAFEFDSHYSGIGRSEHEGYGAAVNLWIRF